jgi:hypothetical protein
VSGGEDRAVAFVDLKLEAVKSDKLPAASTVYSESQPEIGGGIFSEE